MNNSETFKASGERVTEWLIDKSTITIDDIRAMLGATQLGTTQAAKLVVDEYNTKEIIDKLKIILDAGYDVKLLENYSKLLDTKSKEKINMVTNEIILSTERMLIELRKSNELPPRGVAVVLAALLSALAVRRPAPPAPSPARALGPLLAARADGELERVVAQAWWDAGVGAGALLALADAARALPAAMLAEMCLRAAAQRLARGAAAPRWVDGPPSPAELREGAARVPAGERALQLRVAGRALAVEPSRSLAECLLQLARGDLSAHVQVTKLLVLFGMSE